MTGSPDRQNSEGALSGLAAPESVELLIPHASQLLSALKDGLKDLGQTLGAWSCDSHVTGRFARVVAAAVENSVSMERAFVKIAKPTE